MKLQPVRGTHDLYGDNARKHSYIIECARRTASNYGFDEFFTPIFEFSNVFSRTLGEESDIVNKEMYTFEDRGGESITLRPEGTAPIARAFISEGMAQLTPLKLFYHGPMFRYERPQKGRQRQFHQLGVELIGVPSPLADIECIALGATLFEQLSLSSKVSLEINSIGDDASRAQFKEALVSFLNKVKSELSEDSQRRLLTNPLRILDSKNKKDQEIIIEAPKLKDHLNDGSRKFFDQVLQGLHIAGIAYTENHRLVRGLDYYCHTVFEFKTTELGAQDAVLSGGRYDKLITQMGGPDTPGVGFAAGIERLALLMNEAPKKRSPFTLIPLGDAAEKEAIKICYQLRGKELPIDLGYTGNLSKRMKKADKMQSRAAMILGDDELKKQVVTLKDLKTGTQQEVKITELSSFLQQMMSDD